MTRRRGGGSRYSPVFCNVNSECANPFSPVGISIRLSQSVAVVAGRYGAWLPFIQPSYCSLSYGKLAQVPVFPVPK